MSQPQTTASFCALQKPTSHTIQARAQQNYHPSPGKRLTDEWCTMETNQLGSWSGHRQQTQPFTPSLYNAKIMFVVGSKNLPTISLPNNYVHRNNSMELLELPILGPSKAAAKHSKQERSDFKCDCDAHSVPTKSVCL
ncbi:unnamed protein product [Polarella glacialis]|uniref:Uncharacterized protein n=1 Tax=Polarella glacialis TaxID=89957 RepID=A0A813HW48_POLGL|nr:unnamed protein product [Polarella glacialis]